MRLISWNVANRVACLKDQARELDKLRPDIVALQEITPSTVDKWRKELTQIGLAYIRDNVGYRSGRRRYGEIIASHWPLHVLSAFSITWPERVLSVKVSTDLYGAITVHTVHVPCGSSKPPEIKIKVLKGLYNQLAYHVKGHRILCGDFNTPQAETFAGKVITWGQKEKNGKFVTVDPWWDKGERGVLEGLKEYDLSDVYRDLYGCEVKDFSWVLRRKGQIIARRRFDHVYASDALNPVECQYVHSLREKRLSDHSAILAVFQPSKTR